MLVCLSQNVRDNEDMRSSVLPGYKIFSYLYQRVYLTSSTSPRKMQDFPKNIMEDLQWCEPLESIPSSPLVYACRSPKVRLCSFMASSCPGHALIRRTRFCTLDLCLSTRPSKLIRLLNTWSLLNILKNIKGDRTPRWPSFCQHFRLEKEFSKLSEHPNMC
jgi:hypothetical protein